MTGSDRDRAIERLLAVPARQPSQAAAGACVDAETVAAWCDGGVTGAAAAQFEAHVAACASCQELLATVVRMTPIDAPAVPAAPRRPWTSWALPLAAAAVLVLVVWTTWPGGASRSPASPVLEEEARMARTEVPAPVAAPQSPTAPAPGPPAGTASRDAPVPPAGDTTAPPPSAAEPAPFSVAPADRLEREPAPPAASPARQSAQAEGRVEEKVEEKSAVAAPAAPAAAAETAAPRPDASAPAATSTGRVWRAGDASALAGAARARDGAGRVTVQAPGGVWRWRTDRALEYSSDSGSTWRPSGGATAAQVADILAGASPAAQTAWLVGRRGLVLVSIDGVRFEVRIPPAPEDLIAVQATDGRAAIVRSVAGQSWRTADGGRTWAAVAP